MVAVLKCPNCGAPLQSSAAEQRACTYCGALLHVPKPAPAVHAPPLQPQSQSSRTILRIVSLGVLSVTLTVAVATFRRVQSSLSPDPTPHAVAAGVVAPGAVAAAAAQTPAGVAWNRLESIDIHATVEQAQISMKQQFPEAKVEQDKEYRLDLDHPILNSAYYPWDWGCTCLDHVVFFFKDYPTRMKTGEAFIPCLVRGLGPIAKSAPPFDYDWPAHGDIPHVHLGPQLLMLDLPHGTSEASYRNALRVLGACRN
ncbi:MAG: zinc ribbon domain-containing protein [Polyangiaceae bacterium]